MPEQLNMFPDLGDETGEYATMNEEAIERELEEMEEDFRKLVENWCNDV